MAPWPLGDAPLPVHRLAHSPSKHYHSVKKQRLAPATLVHLERIFALSKRRYRLAAPPTRVRLAIRPDASVPPAVARRRPDEIAELAFYPDGVVVSDTVGPDGTERVGFAELVDPGDARRLAGRRVVAVRYSDENAVVADVVADTPGAPVVPLVAPTPSAVAAALPDRGGFSTSSTIYDSRYGDVFFTEDTYKPFGPRTRLRPFVDLYATRDTRTVGGGSVSQQLNDNYMMGGIGLQYADTTGLRLFAEVGGTSPLGPGAVVGTGDGDFRGGLQYQHDIGGEPFASRHGYGNVTVISNYDSRYQDWMFSAQSELITNLARPHRRPLELFVRPLLSLDAQKHYFANLVENSLGVRYYPFGPTGPAISLEGAAGAYIRGGERPPGQGMFYMDFRPTISWGFAL